MRYFRLWDPISPPEGSLYRCDGVVFEYEANGEWFTSDVKERYAPKVEEWFNSQLVVWGPNLARWEEVECPVS